MSLPEGDLWISTNKGISRLDVQKRIFRNGDQIEGTLMPEFFNSTADQSASGEMFLASSKG